MNLVVIKMSLALLVLAGIGCDKKSSTPPERGHSAQEEGVIPIQEIRGIQLMKVPEARVESRWMPGEAQGDEAAQVVLSSPVKGLMSRLVAAPGQPYKAGAPLAFIQSPELARLKAEWLAAKSKWDRARAELARETTLYAAGAGARRDLEAARSEAETAQAGEESARLGLEAVGLKPGEAGACFVLRAPAAGFLAAWKVQRGQGVEAGQALGAFQAAQASIVNVEIPQPGPSGWAPGAQVEVRNTSGKIWKARLEGLPVVLTADTRRLSFRLRFLGGSLPIPGTPVEVKVPMDKGIYVPQSALQQQDGRWGVFRVVDGKAGFQPVQRGLEIKDLVLVQEGLAPGDTLVAEGAYLLKAFQQKRSGSDEEAGHGH